MDCAGLRSPIFGHPDGRTTLLPSTQNQSDLPERIARFHAHIISRIPCMPDTTEARAELEALPLSQLILAYVNFADRFVAPRPRQVIYAPDFWTTRSAHDHIDSVLQIEREIQAGADLSPRLSDKIHAEGYARVEIDKNGKRIFHRWADKDFALNAYGVHHLHMHTKVREKGTRELLYVEFFRFQAAMIMVGDHNSFHDGSLEAAVARNRAASGFVLKGCLPSRTPYTAGENHRLARYGISTTLDIGGAVVPTAMLVSSGHSARSRHLADQITLALENIDSHLEDPGYVERAFGAHAGLLSKPPIFEWYFDYLDLLLVDTKSRVAGTIVTPNR